MRVCDVEGCGRKHAARGWCWPHYGRWRRHGDPLAGGAPKARGYSIPEEAIAARSEPGEGGCLLWTGTLTPKGYGLVTASGKQVQVHRYVYEREHGPLREGEMVDHRCHVHNCIALEHLRSATRSENASNRSGPTRANRTSGARNVYAMGGRWAVRITHSGVRHYFGTYASIEEAAEVAAEKRKELFGDFAGNG